MESHDCLTKKEEILALTVGGCDVSSSFSKKQSYLGHSNIVKMHIFRVNF